VVKNAAGFDISKLMVGSLGTFGALIEMTFKVFPAPAATRTIIADVPEFSRALDAVMKLSISPFDLHCLDIHANGQRIELIIRIAGPPDTLEERIERITAYVGEDFEVFENQIELDYWKDVRDFKWRSDELNLIKVPVTPRQVKLFDNFLGSNQVIRRYAAGANLAWVAWPAPLDDLDNALEEKNLSGLVVLGSSARARIGSKSSNSFYRRVKQGLDPSHRWAEI
jgi:glycolate oxidase FAD binding subunit